MAIEVDQYAEQLGQLLPPGRIWSVRPESTLRRLLLVFGAMLARVHARGDALLAELYPPTTLELLPEWERLLGLPDPCTAGAQTLQERRARVLERLTVTPNATLLYLQRLASILGYVDVVIAEGPGPLEITVEATTGRVTYFRCGESRCGELLGKFDQALDLECLLRENKPAHIAINFSYTGV